MPPDAGEAGLRLEEAVERARRVPSEAKTFTVRASSVCQYGFTDDHVRQLVQAGLPARTVDGETCFEESDLLNIGLLLRLRTPQRRAMDPWSKTLERRPTGGTTRLAVRMTARCPRPGHLGSCEFTVDPVIDDTTTVPGSLAVVRPGTVDFTIELSEEDRVATAAQQQLLASLRALSFHGMPDRLLDDIHFVTTSSLANCDLATRVAVTLGTRDHPIRQAVGYLALPPFPIVHSWPELGVDDHWVPYDPFMINAMREWGIAGSETWPLFRSIAPIVWRCFVEGPGAPPKPFRPMRHQGVPTDTTVVMRRVETDDGATDVARRVMRT
jgi:hypothetical protein